MLLLLFPLWGSSQVVDELTFPIGTQPAVGAVGADYLSQSFLADIRTVNRLGVWLRADSALGEVRVLLMADDGNGFPDPQVLLYQSPVFQPADTGLTFYLDTTLSTPLILGNRYHIAIDGTVSSSGFSVVGYSNAFTDTGEPMKFSVDGGNSWSTIANRPMAVHVEGDTCATAVTLYANRTVVCPGDTVTLYVDQTYASYAWSNGDTVFFTNITQPGTYTIAVSDANGCGASASVNLPASPPVFSGLDSIYYACDGGSFSLAADPGYQVYVWSDGTTTNATTFADSGEVWVFVQDSAGCFVQDTVRLAYYPNPTTYIGADTGICQGQFLIVDAGPGFGAYLWNDGQTTRTIVVSSTDTVQVQVIDSTGCFGYSNTRVITVLQLPANPDITLQGDFLFSTVALQYQWYLDGIAIPGATDINFQPLANGSYQVEVFNSFGCSILSDPFLISNFANPNFIPEGFSPNGDGINDAFVIGQIEFYPDNELRIFNRWGKEVFSEKPYRNNWYGQGPGGAILSTGNYFFTLDLGTGAQPLNGVIFLQR